MQSERFRYCLEKYNGRHTRYECPLCAVKQSFTRYIDKVTNTYLHPNVGLCNRVINCDYHLTPKEFFEDSKAPNLGQWTRPAAPTVIKDEIFITPGTLKKTLGKYDQNHFFQYLLSFFGFDIASSLAKRYVIGTSKHWFGANVFYQIDQDGNIRRGKIMLYNQVTGQRLKDHKPTSVHTLMRNANSKPNECFFGEHLLKGNDQIVAIVESEKTAIMCSAYMPEYVWLASGGLSLLSGDKCKVLIGRKVILYPDINGHQKWSVKAKELSKYAIVVVSNLIERRATDEERQQGLDLADYLIKYNLNDFRRV